MGLMKRAAFEANQLRRSKRTPGAKTKVVAGSRGAKGVRVGVSDTGITEEVLTQFPILLRRKVLSEAVKAAGRVVRDGARRELSATRSRTTGTRRLWSEKIKQRRAGNKDLYQSIKIKYKDYERSRVAVCFVGPSWPDGAHGHLIEFGGYHPLWGRSGFEIYEPPNPFMRRAGIGTAAKQRSVAVGVVERMWQDV